MKGAVYLPFVLLAGSVGTVVGGTAWRNRDRPGAVPLTVFVVAASSWAIVDALQIATADLGRLRLLQQVAFTLSAVIPVAWLWTVLAFTGRRRFLRGRAAGLVLLEPIAFVVLVWTSGTGATGIGIAGSALAAVDSSVAGVGTAAFGVAFWAHQVYTYLLVTAGALVLLSIILRTDGVYRNQGTALLGAIAIPMIGHALYLFDVVTADPTGLGYVFGGLVVAGAILRDDIFEFAPITRELGREEAISELEDGVFILDEDDRIVDANAAAEGLVERPAGDIVGEHLAGILPELAPAPGADLPDEVRLEREGKHCHYDVRVSSIGGYGAVGGRLLSLRDVTERHHREERIDVLNRLLRHNLRNEMNVVRGNVSLALEQVEDGAVADRLDRVVETVDTVIDRSNKVGTLTRTMEGRPEQPVDVARLVEEELAECRRAHPEADLAAALPERCWVAAGPSLSVVWNELVTNAIEHNDGDPSVRVAVDEAESDDGTVVLNVVDDGPGMDEQEWRALAAGGETPLQHGSGFGLWMVNWILRTYGASFSFANDGIEGAGTGVTVTVALPRASPPGDDDQGDAGGEGDAG